MSVPTPGTVSIIILTGMPPDWEEFGMNVDPRSILTEAVSREDRKPAL